MKRNKQQYRVESLSNVHVGTSPILSLNVQNVLEKWKSECLGSKVYPLLRGFCIMSFVSYIGGSTAYQPSFVEQDAHYTTHDIVTCMTEMMRPLWITN